jgi:hypothetical protein
MKSVKQVSLASLIAIVTLSVQASAEAAPRKAPVSGTLIANILDLPVATIPKTCPTLEISKVVKIIINGSLDINRVTRKVHEKPYDKPADDEVSTGGEGGVIGQPSTPISRTPTRLDLDLSSYLNTAPTIADVPRAVLIKVILRSPRLTLMAGNAGVYSTNDDTMFCGLDRKADGRVVQFKAMRVPTVGYVGGFTVGIIVNDLGNSTYSMPVLLDPSVKNNG